MKYCFRFGKTVLILPINLRLRQKLKNLINTVIQKYKFFLKKIGVTSDDFSYQMFFNDTSTNLVVVNYLRFRVKFEDCLQLMLYNEKKNE